MTRIQPLTLEELDQRGIDISPFLHEFQELPGSVATLGHRPDILQATLGLWNAIMGPGRVPYDLKYLVGYMASMAAGCRYCSAHTASKAAEAGTSGEKLAAVHNYERDPLFTDAERSALNFALLAGQSPSGVTDDDVEQLKEFFDEAAIVEILAVVSLYGFFNRWNDSLATTLEAAPREFAERFLVSKGWEIGNHGQ